MLKNHLLITLRRLSRKKGYAFLNVVGLALGLAVFGILMLFVRYETSYEQFHEKVDRIHILISEDGPEYRRSVNTVQRLAYGRIIEEAMPEVEHTIRTLRTEFSLVRVEGEITPLSSVRAFFVDRSVFDVFTFPLIAGDPQSALNTPRTAVIDRNAAIQLLGTDDPDKVMGRTFEHDNFLFEITGLMENVPPTTTWRPNVLLSLETHLVNPDWNYNSPYTLAFQTFILYRTPDPDPEVLSKAVDALPDEFSHLVDPAFYSQPIRDIRLYGSPDMPAGELTRLRIFSLVAFLILLLAAINYVNLATAYGMQRTREVGVRKTLGASREQIVGQSLTESILLAVVAGGLALVLISFATPYFSNALRIEMTFGWEPAIVFAFIGMALLVGLVAGAYPSITLSGAQPNEVFRTGKVTGRKGAGLRQVLVVFQFSVGIALVVVSLVIVRQINFMQNSPLGIDPDQLIELFLGFGQDVPAPPLIDRLQQIPEVTDIAAGWMIPGGRSRGRSSYMLSEDADTTMIYILEIRMEPHAPQLMGMELIAGDWFSDDDPQDMTAATMGQDTGRHPIILNETAVRIRGWTVEEAIGREFPFDGDRPIKGVVRDFYYSSMRNEIESVRINPTEATDAYPPLLLISFEQGKDRQVMDAVQVVWGELVPDFPFQATFLKDRFEDFYGAERRLAGLFWAFGIIAVIIACLGLFGLAAFTAERRVKEVGIRKVLGADTNSIVQLLSKDFAKLVVIAFVVAAPVAWWAMNRWLDDFAYHITLGPGIFLVAGLGALVVALVTVSYHAIRAANTDPVRSLRSE